MTQTSSYVVGLMSGTSLDGVDAALVKIDEENNDIKVNLVEYLSQPYSDDIKEDLTRLVVPETAHVESISSMNMYLGEVYADISLQVIKKAGLSTEDILLISSHGQTIFHQPDPVLMDDKEITSTLQIGDIGVMAERTGITTVGDFRTRDIAAGGQGAPLVPYADYLLFRDSKHDRVLVNIGGIANITVIPKDAKESDVFAYDTGPGNMIIDAFTVLATNGEDSYDKNGAIAKKGMVNTEWLEELKRHGYFKLNHPKSTGREMFGFNYAQALWNEADMLGISHIDRIATITELTAITIANEIKRHSDKNDINEVLVSGGGRYNETLMERISKHLSKEAAVSGTEKYGVDADAKEAIIFALLGYQCYHKRANNLPSATGANKAVVMGKIAW